MGQSHFKRRYCLLFSGIVGGSRNIGDNRERYELEDEMFYINLGKDIDNQRK